MPISVSKGFGHVMRTIKMSPSSQVSTLDLDGPGKQ